MERVLDAVVARHRAETLIGIEHRNGAAAPCSSGQFGHGTIDPGAIRNYLKNRREKDAVKLAGLARDNDWYLPVEAELDPVFEHRLDLLLKGFDDG